MTERRQRAPAATTSDIADAEISRRCTERHRRMRAIWEAEGRGRYREARA